MKPKPFDGLQTYIDTVRKIPLLTPKEEADLGRRVLAGEMEARHELVRRNLRLVIVIARKAARLARGHFDDLVAEGNTGLFRATATWDHRESRFSTYATWWIRSRIGEYVLNKRDAIRIPEYLADIKSKVRRGVELSPWQETAWRSHGADASPHAVSIECGDENSALVRLFWSRTCEDPSADIDMIDSVDVALSCLVARDREVVRDSAINGQTHKEISLRLGVSRERVRQIYRRAIDHVRDNMERRAS